MIKKLLTFCYWKDSNKTIFSKLVQIVDSIPSIFAGVNPGVNESRTYEQKSVSISKRGSSALRRILFQIMDILMKTHPQDESVYQFLDKKRVQCKPYYVYMTAGVNKFLRIYYGRVKEYLASLPES